MGFVHYIYTHTNPPPLSNTKPHKNTRQDPCSWIRLLAKTESTWAAGPDFAYRLCAKKWDAQKWPPSQYSLTYMIYMHTGAEPIRKVGVFFWRGGGGLGGMT